MINETKLLTLLDELQTWIGYVDSNDDSNFDDLWTAINDVMLDLDTEDTNQDDGWIPWHGGQQPVPDGTPVEVRFRGGHVDSYNTSDNWYWVNDDKEYDIVAYRVTGYKSEPQPPIIPDGVPCWVTNSDGERYLRVATGERDTYYQHGRETGETKSVAPGTMRPVCFPENWDQLPECVTHIELRKMDGVWWGFVHNDDRGIYPGNYYERRPI